MVVVSGSNAQQVAEQLAQSLGWSHVKLEARRFPDSEGYIRIPETEIEAIRLLTWEAAWMLDKDKDDASKNVRI